VADQLIATGDLHLKNLVKSFGEFTAVAGIDLTVPVGSFFALLGPSGCGKTTTLRMIAGLEEPTSGEIYIGDQDVTYTRPFRRPVNTVFQNYALFPHLTIFENVAFGLRRRGMKDVKSEVERVLKLVELPEMSSRKPNQLSGGQQQRIALARAIVNNPALLLLDEPLGALDLKLRKQMQIELKRIQLEVGLTFIHVTHDQEEAMTMADTIAVMNEGRIEQMGSPIDLYDNPNTAFVANFLGQSNLIRGQIVDRDGDYHVVEVLGIKIKVPVKRCNNRDNSILVGVRPEKLRLHISAPATSGNIFRGGKVIDVSYIGVSTQYLIELPGGESVMVFEQNDDGVQPARKGDLVEISWEPDFTFGLAGDQDISAGSELETAE
jgi:spermidine/putrescine transport system ATP-binding protein